MRKTTLALATLAMLTGTAQAQIYKCTDPATGKTTYSQMQCATNAAPADIHVATPSEEEQRRAHMRAEQAKSEVEAIRRQRELAQAERERIAADINAKTIEQESEDRSRVQYRMDSLQKIIDESDATIRHLERLQRRR